MRGAAPFLSEARGLKAQAGRDVSNIVGQQETAEVGRLGLGSAIGALRRDIVQAKLDAAFQKKLADIEHRFKTQPHILSLATTTPESVVSGGGPTGLQSAMGAAGSIAQILAGLNKTNLPGNQAAITAAGGLGNVANMSSDWLADSYGW